MRVAYLVSRFPNLTETFVVREMDALVRLGVDIDLYTLVDQRQSVVSDASQAWLPHVRSRPWLSPALLGDDVRALARAPRAAAVNARILAAHRRNPRFLGRAVAMMPKSVAFGEDMHRRGVRHVHAHFATHAALAAMMASRVSGGTFSFTVHAHDLYVDRTFLPEKIRAAAFVATVSEFNRRWLGQLAPDVADRIHVVRCGVDMTSTVPRVVAPTDERSPRILAVAQLSPYKGLRHLVEATALLRARLPGLTVTIVGDGPERAALSRQVAELGLADTIHFAGARPAEEISGFLDEADLFVLPSVRQPNGKMDGLPVALMEAMAAGVPVIASDLSGIPELVRHDSTGLLAAPGDASGIADAVERLWADSQLRERLAAAGSLAVREEFDIDANARRLLALLEGVA